MKRLLLLSAAFVMGSALLVQAQATVPVSLTAKQVDALQVAFGADVNVPAKVQAWVDDWLVQFVRDRDEREKRDLKAALDSTSPAVAAQVRALLKVADVKAVTAEERAKATEAKAAVDKVDAAVSPLLAAIRLLTPAQCASAQIASGLALPCALAGGKP
jgi:hypothetical protein